MSDTPVIGTWVVIPGPEPFPAVVAAADMNDCLLFVCRPDGGGDLSSLALRTGADAWTCAVLGNHLVGPEGFPLVWVDEGFEVERWPAVELEQVMGPKYGPKPHVRLHLVVDDGFRIGDMRRVPMDEAGRRPQMLGWYPPRLEASLSHMWAAGERHLIGSEPPRPLGRSGPRPEVPPTHFVTVRVPEPLLGRQLGKVERALERAARKAPGAEFDGCGHGPHDTELFLMGPDGERLHAAVAAALRRLRLPQGTTISVSSGAGTGDERPLG